MRGTRNRAAYDAFLTGQRYYSLASREELEKSSDAFRLAVALDADFGRAWSGLAYNLLQMWLMGWAEEAVLKEAEEAALRAVRADLDDYFTHSYLGFFYLHTKRFRLAIKSYETALGLNEDDRTLMADAAEAYVYCGEIDTGIKLLERARRIPDWHRWDLAWAYYFKAREDPGYYDRALEELDQLHYRRGADKHLVDIDLLVAAIHAQKGDRAEAGEALGHFLRARPGWTLEQERRSVNFKLAADEEHWLDGVRKAGLPSRRSAARRRPRG